MITTYCLHHTPATERKEYLLNNFDTKGWLWIEDFLPTDDNIRNHPTIYSEHSSNKIFLSLSELSLFYKHKLAIELICGHKEFALIIEDDIALPNFEFYSTLSILLNLMKKEGTDLLFVGSYGSCDLKCEAPTIVCSKNTLTRCAHAYIVNPSCSKLLLNYLNDINSPLDWQLNYAIQDLNLKSCWSYPHIYQRSEKKQIRSLLR